MTPRTLIAAIITLCVVAATPALAQSNSSVERGMKVFAERKCSMCHAIAGKGNPKGPLDGMGVKLTAEETRQWLTNPDEMRKQTKAERKPEMKSFASLPKDDLDALVAYLQTLKKR